MLIKKELKHATFEYDEDTKAFTLYDCEGMNGTIELNKVYAFAFMRFVIRMAQRNWLRNKPIKKTQPPKEEATNNDEMPTDQSEFDMFNIALPLAYDEEDFDNNPNE